MNKNVNIGQLKYSILQDRKAGLVHVTENPQSKADKVGVDISR